VRNDLDAKLIDARTDLAQERAAHQQTRDMLSHAIAAAPAATPKTKSRRVARRSADAGC